MLIRVATMMLLGSFAVASAQDGKGSEAPKTAWQKPGEIKQPGAIQPPTGPWIKPGEIQSPTGPVTKAGEVEPATGPGIRTGEIKAPTGPWIQPGAIQPPTGPWIQPGEIKPPTGPWIQPGEIQVPKGIEAVQATEQACERRVTVLGDALFDFDKSTLRPDAEETLAAAGPDIAKLAQGAATVEGHTDSIGGEAYNLRLSEARAKAARDWLVAHGFLPASTPIKGYGKSKPVAPNLTADGQDNPEGRQKNRRVEIVFATCG